eukprot:g64769.t1
MKKANKVSTPSIRCTKASPSLPGDPITSFALDEKAGFLITGSAFGRICLWRIDHVVNDDSDQSDGKQPPRREPLSDIASTDKQPLSPSESASPVPTKGRKRPSLRVPASLSSKRQSATRKTRLTRYIPEETDPEFRYICRILTKQSPEAVSGIFCDPELGLFAVIGDLHYRYWGSFADVGGTSSNFRRSVSHTYRTCDDSFTLVAGCQVLILTRGREGFWQDLSNKTRRDVKIELSSGAVPVAFDGERAVIQTMMKKGGSEIVVVKLDGTEEQKLTFPRSHTADWGFRLCGDVLVHVCCRNKIKTWDVATGKCLSRLQVCTQADLIAYDAALTEEGVSIVTIASDRTLKVWQGKSCLGYFSGLLGKFRLNYPYIIVRQGRRICYTADDGVFTVLLPDTWPFRLFILYKLVGIVAETQRSSLFSADDRKFDILILIPWQSVRKA